MTLSEAILVHCSQLTANDTLWVAYSGGLDSEVLLHLCHAAQQSQAFNLRAIHVNHGISPFANEWEKHCQTVCHALNIPLDIERLPAFLSDQNLEEVARNKRYACFKRRLKPGDKLFTGHHEDDQAETFLLQLMRGAGVRGLSAMPDIKVFGLGQHHRPLLAFSRTALYQFAVSNALQWVEDESNASLFFDRNYLRHAVLPHLNARWQASHLIARSAKHCAETSALLTDYAKSLAQDVRGVLANTLSMSKLAALSPVKQRLVLRLVIHEVGALFPSEKKLLTLQQQMLTARNDKMPQVQLAKVVVRRYQDVLYILPLAPTEQPRAEQVWELNTPCKLPGIGVLSCSYEAAGQLKQVMVRFRKGGEVIKLPGRGRRELKKLLQEWRIPPWLRDNIPLIFVEDKLACVVGYATAAEFMSLNFQLHPLA